MPPSTGRAVAQGGAVEAAHEVADAAGHVFRLHDFIGLGAKSALIHSHRWQIGAAAATTRSVLPLPAPTGEATPCAKTSPWLTTTATS